MTWCLDLVFREIYTFPLDFVTGPNIIESSSKSRSTQTSKSQGTLL